MLRQLRPAIVLVLLLTVITGLAYPLAITGIVQVVFPHQANGSLIVKDGKVIGSELIGQAFKGPGYFQPRPSAAGQGYDGAASGGSNLGPTSRVLVERVTASAADWSKLNPGKPIPVDLVTASASGLDPDISPAAAEFQAPVVAMARGLPEAQVRSLISDNTTGRQYGLLGEPRVSVLRLNMALDAVVTKQAQTR